MPNRRLRSLLISCQTSKSKGKVHHWLLALNDAIKVIRGPFLDGLSLNEPILQSNPSNKCKRNEPSEVPTSSDWISALDGKGKTETADEYTAGLALLAWPADLELFKKPFPGESRC